MLIHFLIQRLLSIYTNPLNSGRQSLSELREFYETAIGKADCSLRSRRSPKLRYLSGFWGLVLETESENND